MLAYLNDLLTHMGLPTPTTPAPQPRPLAHPRLPDLPSVTPDDDLSFELNVRPDLDSDRGHCQTRARRENDVWRKAYATTRHYALLWRQIFRSCSSGLTLR